MEVREAHSLPAGLFPELFSKRPEVHFSHLQGPEYKPEAKPHRGPGEDEYGDTTGEQRADSSKKLKLEIPLDPAIPQRDETHDSDPRTPMSIAAQLKSSLCVHQQMKGQEDVVFTLNGALLCHKQGQAWVIYKKMRPCVHDVR